MKQGEDVRRARPADWDEHGSDAGRAARLKESGAVHVTDLNDNPWRARLSPSWPPSRSSERSGQTILHDARDASIMGLSRSSSARTPKDSERPGGDRRPAARGRLPRVERRVRSRLDRACASARASERWRDYSGKAIDAPTSFYVGVAVNPSADDFATEIERFKRKLDAGASFAMTQALFDLSYSLDRWKRSGASRRFRSSSAFGRCRASNSPSGCTTRCPGSRFRTRSRRRLRTPGPMRAKSVSTRVQADRGSLRPRGGDLHHPAFKEPAAALELLAP